MRLVVFRAKDFLLRGACRFCIFCFYPGCAMPLHKSLWPPVIAVLIPLFLLLFWQVAVRLFLIPEWLLPAPLDIIFALVDSWQLMLPHLGQTLIEVFVGLFTAVVAGVSCAALLDCSSIVRRAIYPLLIISQTFPVIVLAPLLVIWFGFGLLPKVIVVSLFCFFPIAMNTTDGLSSTSEEITNLFHSMNANWWQFWLKARLPSALPCFFSGLKIAASYSVIAAVVGEWVGAEQGLGIYLLRTSASYQTVQVFAVISVISVLSMLVFSFIVLLERFSIPWHFSSASTKYLTQDFPK